MSNEEDGPRQRAAETKRRRTRDHVVTATIELYEDSDQADHTREQIAEAAGVGVATLHNHFNSKYGVLRAAYERVISPVVEPITRAHKADTYAPPDRVEELCHYIYRVSKLSWEHRSLTVAMVRSYFDAAFGPGERGEQDWDLGERLTWPIIAGVVPIMSDATFLHPWGVSNRTRMDHHCYALLMDILHRPVYGNAKETATLFLGEFLPAFLRPEDQHDIHEKIKRAVESE